MDDISMQIKLLTRKDKYSKEQISSLGFTENACNSRISNEKMNKTNDNRLSVLIADNFGS